MRGVDTTQRLGVAPPPPKAIGEKFSTGGVDQPDLYKLRDAEAIKQNIPITSSRKHVLKRPSSVLAERDAPSAANGTKLKRDAPSVMKSTKLKRKRRKLKSSKKSSACAVSQRLHVVHEPRMVADASGEVHLEPGDNELLGEQGVDEESSANDADSVAYSSMSGPPDMGLESETEWFLTR